MKKFLLLLLLVPFLFGFNWVTANQGTFQWDAITADDQGNPPPSGTHIEYEVYIIDSITNIATVSEVTTLVQSTVTLPQPGRYWVGVKTILLDDSSGERLKESQEMSRSDNPQDCLDAIVFGFQMWPNFLNPGGLHQ